MKGQQTQRHSRCKKVPTQWKAPKQTTEAKGQSSNKLIFSITQKNMNSPQEVQQWFYIYLFSWNFFDFSHKIQFQGSKPLEYLKICALSSFMIIVSQTDFSQTQGDLPLFSSYRLGNAQLAGPLPLLLSWFKHLFLLLKSVLFSIAPFLWMPWLLGPSPGNPSCPCVPYWKWVWQCDLTKLYLLPSLTV